MNQLAPVSPAAVLDNAQGEEYINPITSKVSGYIRRIRYAENQTVKAGDTLVVLDNRDFEVPVAEAEAALASTVQTSQRSSRVSQSQIGQLRRVHRSAQGHCIPL